jgi:hypothetical protein
MQWGRASGCLNLRYQAGHEYRYAALSRRMLHRLSTKSHAQQKPKYLSEMSETQWPHTLHISLNQKKSDGPVFQTGGSGLGR